MTFLYFIMILHDSFLEVGGDIVQFTVRGDDLFG